MKKRRLGNILVVGGILLLGYAAARARRAAGAWRKGLAAVTGVVVLGMGVYLGQSTPIYNRETDEITYGRVPSGSVVVSGSLPKANGKYNLYCAVIVKRVDAQTRSKTSINELLRA